MKRFLCGLVALSLVVGITEQVKADTLVYFGEPPNNGPPKLLFNFDTATGISTERVMVPGVERFSGFDVRPSDQQVFAVSQSGGLYTMNIETGTPTLIGATGIQEPWGIAFQPSTNALFVISNFGGLFSANPTTGAATFIGNSFPITRGLSFSPTGELFGFDNTGALYTFNLATERAVFVGGSGSIPVPDIAEDSTFTSDGQFFHADYDGDIFRVDPATGDRIQVGRSGGDRILGLFTLPTVSPVPEPSTLLLLATGSIALLICAWRQLSGLPREPIGDPGNDVASRIGVNGQPAVARI